VRAGGVERPSKLLNPHVDGKTDKPGGGEMPIEGKDVPNALRPHGHEAAGVDEAEVLVGELSQQAKCASLMIRLYEDPFQAPAVVELVEEADGRGMAAGDAQECIGFPHDLVAGHENMRPGDHPAQSLYRVAVPLIAGDLDRIPGPGVHEHTMRTHSARRPPALCCGQDAVVPPRHMPLSRAARLGNESQEGVVRFGFGAEEQIEATAHQA